MPLSICGQSLLRLTPACVREQLAGKDTSQIRVSKHFMFSEAHKNANKKVRSTTVLNNLH